MQCTLSKKGSMNCMIYIVLFTCIRIYLYNVLQLERGPVKSFHGCQIGSFFVKVSIVFKPYNPIFQCKLKFCVLRYQHFDHALQSCISPDATHILSGSSDGYAYIWQVMFFPPSSIRCFSQFGTD